MRRVILFSGFLFCLLIASVLPDDAVGKGKVRDWADAVQEIRLDNGMKFLVVRHGEAPIFSAYIRVKVGGLDEEPGKTGIAHFLEHMAFKGTKTLGTKDYEKEKPLLDEIERIGEQLAEEYKKGAKADSEKIKSLRGEIARLHSEEEKYLVKEEVAKKTTENGGTDQNATTSKDITSYFVSLPSDKLRFWAELESERIFHPVFREFYEEKDVVLEERRMRVDNDPDGILYEKFLEKAFEEGSPYRWPTIGSVQDLMQLTRKDLETFWREHYKPENVVGALVGRIDVGEARTILESTFGRIPASPVSTADSPIKKKGDQVSIKEKTQDKEKILTLSLPALKARPRLLIGYPKPTLPSPDDYAFDLLSEILGEGRSSRFSKALVFEKRIAESVGTATDVPGARLPNLFLIEAHPMSGYTPEEVVKAIDEEIQKVVKDGVTERELQKAKNRLTVGLLWEMQTNEGLASHLSYYESLAGSWRYLSEYIDQINRFTPADLKTVAERYLKRENRTVGILK